MACRNHPDIDLADAALNTSGVPWHTLHYEGSYPRLQRIKARWDPGDVFRHALSIRASEARIALGRNHSEVHAKGE